jgi:hypothetical protein
MRCTASMQAQRTNRMVLPRKEIDSMLTPSSSGTGSEQDEYPNWTTRMIVDQYHITKFASEPGLTGR